MAVLFGPTTRVINLTKDVMVVVTVDEFEYTLSEKRIESGGFADFEYREGIGRIGPKIHYLVYPQNRCASPKKILPYDVFISADINISYELPDGSVARNYQLGAVLHFRPRSGTICGRIGFVRYANSIITAVFGNCCSATHVRNPGEAAGPPAVVVAPGPASDPIQAPLALEEAQDLAIYPIEALDLAPALHAGIDIPSAPQAAAPTPLSEIELVITYLSI